MPLPGGLMRQKIKKRLQGLSSDQRIKEIDRILEEIPWTVGDYKEIVNELRRQREAERDIISVRHSAKSKYYVKKETPQSMIIGLPNSGKSTLLASLTSSPVKMASYPFTTQKPEVGSLVHNDVRIQMVELPAFYEGVSTQNKALVALLRTTDAVINVINKTEEWEALSGELEASRIRLFNRKRENYEKYSEGLTYLPAMVVYRRLEPRTELETMPFADLDGIKQELYGQLNISRIYLRDRRGNVSLPPTIFLDIEDVTVEDVTGKAGKRFLREFRYAKIWGPSATYDGERAGLKRRLKDGDTVTIYT